MLCQLTRGIILFRNRAISLWKPDLSSLEAALPGFSAPGILPEPAIVLWFWNGEKRQIKEWRL